jgi:hypothetical protein
MVQPFMMPDADPTCEAMMATATVALSRFYCQQLCYASGNVTVTTRKMVTNVSVSRSTVGRMVTKWPTGLGLPGLLLRCDCRMHCNTLIMHLQAILDSFIGAADEVSRVCAACS